MAPQLSVAVFPHAGSSHWHVTSCGLVVGAKDAAAHHNVTLMYLTVGLGVAVARMVQRR